MGRPPLPDDKRRVRVSYRVKPETAAAVEQARKEGEGLGQVLDRWADVERLAMMQDRFNRGEAP